MNGRFSYHPKIAILLVISFICLLPMQVIAMSLFQEDSPSGQAVALYQEADWLTQNGEWQAALTKFEAARRLFHQAGDRPREALCLHQIGFLKERLADYQGALAAYQASLALWRETDFQGYEAATLSSLGGLYYDLGRLQEALTTLQESLAIQQHRDDPRQGSTLNKLGVVYAAQGAYAKALTAHQQALVILREIDDQVGVGAALQNIAYVYGQTGRYTEALATYQEALEISKRAHDRFGEATVYNNIGGVYDQWGRYEEAIDAYQESLQIRQAIDDWAGQGVTQHNIALYYERLGQYEKALETYQKALALHQYVGNLQSEGATHSNIGSLYRTLGEHESSLTYLQRALAIQQQIGDRAGEGNTLNHLGDVASDQGRYADALFLYQQALDIHRMIGHTVGEGDSLDHIGLTYDYQGRYEEALASLTQALTIRQTIGDQAGASGTLNNIGMVYNHLDQHAEALNAYQQALTIQQLIGEQARVARTLSNMAVDYHALGQLTEALKRYKQALAIQKTIGDRAGENATLSNIGAVYISQGAYVQAINTYQQALAIQKAINDPFGASATYNNIGTVYVTQGVYTAALTSLQQALTIRQQIGDQDGEALTLSNLGYLQEILRHPDEAIRYYQQSITVTESIQGAIGIEELKSSFVSGHNNVYTSLIDLLWRQNRGKEAFAYAERAKARAFLDQIGNQQVHFREGAASVLLENERALSQKITGLQSTLTMERGKSLDQQSQELITKLSEELEAARKQLSQLLIRLKLANPEYTSMISVNTLSLDEVQKEVIDDKTTLIEYFVMNEQVLAWVIDKNGFAVVRLAIHYTDLQEQITFLRDLIAEKDFDREAAATLYQAIFAPLKPYIHHPNLVIAPHGILHYLPFAALWNSEDQQYLIEAYSVTYTPSASVLKFIINKRNVNNERLLALGNPDGSLSHAEAEVKNLAHFYGTSALVRQQAMESTLYRESQRIDILHIAAHGVYDPYNPLYTRLELAADPLVQAKAEVDRQSDGNLEVEEIFGLDLKNANLVVLSACNSGLSEHSTGDELVGLTRAFLYAGSPAVVTTLWSINDAASSALMESFYRHLQAGKGNAEALRAAQLEVKTQEKWESPYYWAAFELTGDYLGITE